MGERGEATIVCGNCGAVNDAGARFCRTCGVLLAAYAVARPQAPVVDGEERAAPVAQAPSGGAPGPAGPTATAFAGWGDERGTADDWLARAPTGAASGDQVFWDPARLGDGGVPPAEAPISGPAASSLTPAGPAVAPAASSSGATATATAPDSAAAPLGLSDVADRIADEPPVTSALPSGAAFGSAVPTPPMVGRTRWTAPPTSALFPSGVGGGWLERTPPRTIGLVGAALLLLSCVWFVGAGAAEADGHAAFALFCLAPIGAIAVVVGLVMRAVKRPRRRG